LVFVENTLLIKNETIQEPRPNYNISIFLFKCYPFFVSQVAFPRIVKKNFNCKEQGNHVSMEDVPVFWEGARERRRIIRYPTSAHSSRHIATACSTTYTSLYL